MKTHLKHKLIVAAFCLTTLALSPITTFAAPSDYLSLEVTVTPVGSDWLRANTNIQAVLVDAKGQATTKPSAIKITNAGKMSCTISSPLITENGVVQPNQSAIFNLNGIKPELITLKDINVTVKLWQGDLSNKTTNDTPTTPNNTKPVVAPQPEISRRKKIEQIDEKLKSEVEKLRDGTVIPVAVPDVVVTAPVAPTVTQPKTSQNPIAIPVPLPKSNVEPAKAPVVKAPAVMILPITPPAVTPPVIPPQVPETPKGPAKPDWMTQTSEQVNEYGNTTKTVTNIKATKTEIVVDSNATTNLAKTLTITTIPLDAFTVKRVFTKTGDAANPISYSLLLNSIPGRNFSRHRTRVIIQDNSSHEDDANVNLLALQFNNEASALEAEKALTALKNPAQRDEILRLLGVVG